MTSTAKTKQVVAFHQSMRDNEKCGTPGDERNYKSETERSVDILRRNGISLSDVAAMKAELKNGNLTDGAKEVLLAEIAKRENPRGIVPANSEPVVDHFQPFPGDPIVAPVDASDSGTSTLKGQITRGFLRLGKGPTLRVGDKRIELVGKTKKIDDELLAIGMAADNNLVIHEVVGEFISTPLGRKFKVSESPEREYTLRRTGPTGPPSSTVSTVGVPELNALISSELQDGFDYEGGSLYTREFPEARTRDEILKRLATGDHRTNVDINSQDWFGDPGNDKSGQAALEKFAEHLTAWVAKESPSWNQHPNMATQIESFLEEFKKKMTPVSRFTDIKLVSHALDNNYNMTQMALIAKKPDGSQLATFFQFDPF